MIKALDELLSSAQGGDRVKVAVAAAQDEAAFTAIINAIKAGFATALLYGDSDKISAMLSKVSNSIREFVKINDFPSDQQAARRAVEAVYKSEAQILLKGQVKTAILLNAVLDSKIGLRRGRLLSDIFLFENPYRKDNKLMMITDGGVTLKPDIHQKIQIIENAVSVAHALGHENPKVALLSAIETVNANLPTTAEAAVITKMNQRGQIKNCTIDGPFALDNAVSEEAARIKGIESPVAGKADILVCPEIESANMLAKSTTYFAKFRLAHVIIGAIAPILIPSRADTAEAKLLSIALGKLLCQC